ncbi:C2 domain protein [Ancylostoma duodenale]|uniref:C2 domain protein n=1 Tax=Ancylostoma duodenale TaxID=51022 RepID=A0A0C2HBG3_9BILA|nr:C2 domain protein [Ancylostoma duodenale]
MVLHKTDNSRSGDLGLKVVGGRRTDTGRLGAFITRVKPGSVADTVGRLRAGDEVLEWNGQALQNATFDQVYEIISASKQDSHVEIIVSRSASIPGGDDFLNVQTQSRQLPSLQYLLSQGHNFGRGQIFGRIEISLYFSHVERQLTVCIERVDDLPPRADGSPRNPYVKVFLLPDRSEKSRRQTSVLAEAIRPIWNESFYYQGITEPMLMERVLEVTVWDYDKFEANSFLGETLVDFSSASLDGQTMTLPLVDMDEENPLRLRLKSRKGKHYATYQRPRSEMSFLHNDKSPGNAAVTASEMGASRAYYRTIPEPLWDDVDFTHEGRSNPQGMSPFGAPEARLSNGRPVGEMMQEQEPQQGYGSDGSETMSTHSAHSIPTVRTINRRSTSINEVNDVQETSLEEYASEDVQSTSGTAAKLSVAGQTMKERKKSIMTRFIPGKSGGTGTIRMVFCLTVVPASQHTITFILEGKRTGFLRSEEVGIPGNMSVNRAQQQQFVKQASKDSTDSASDNWLPVLPDGPLGTFVENLGPGQVVGRQVLASPLLGEIQVGIMAGRSGIDVEIIRAKNLVVKPGVKISPAPYVKVYLMEGKMCVAKAKTNPITVLGDYGRMERKTFMGIALIRLDDLRLGSEPVIGWYKLYHSSSLAGTGPVRKDSETSLAGPNTLQY